MSGNSLIFLCRPVGRVHGVVGKVHTLFAARPGHTGTPRPRAESATRKALTRQQQRGGRQSPRTLVGRVHTPARHCAAYTGAGRDALWSRWRPARSWCKHKRSLLLAALLATHGEWADGLLPIKRGIHSRRLHCVDAERLLMTHPGIENSVTERDEPLISAILVHVPLTSLRTSAARALAAAYRWPPRSAPESSPVAHRADFHRARAGGVPAIAPS